MTAELETQERDALEEIRRRYEQQGYQFISEPKSTDIPSFLEGFIPDAIAIGTDDKVIIEVKSTQSSASESAAIRFLASEVPKHRGWRFDLVVAETADKRGDTVAEPDAGQLRMELDKVRKFLAAGDNKVALVVAWALLEAVTRRLILNQQAGEPKRYLPATIVETLVSEGFVDDEDRLLRLSRARNRLVHGFTRIDVEDDDMQFLVGIIETLIAGLG